MRFASLLSLFLFLSLWVCHGTNSSTLQGPGEDYASNRSFVFVSGFPQSGTSLVQQMLTVSPYFSTQVAKCFEFHGTKCANWNSEGQWLLLRDTVFDRAFKPGRMCPVEPSLLEDIEFFSAAKYKLHMEWGKYWDLKDRSSSPSSPASRLSSARNPVKILVEKSPQNMVKISFIAAAFQQARSLRFIVVIKHPATLNIALPRGFQWLSREPPSVSSANKGYQTGFPPQKPQRIPWNSTDLIEGFQYFINFMTANVSTGSKCNLGWLSTMEELLKSVQGTLSSNVSIVKYEDFIDPIETCQNLMNVVVADGAINNMENFGRFCRKNFSPKPRAGNTFKKSEQALAQHREKYTRLDGLNRRSSGYRFQHRRKLRLKGVSRGNGGAIMTGIKEKTGYQLLDFDLRMLESSVHSRLVDFNKAYMMLMHLKDSNLQDKVTEIVSEIHNINRRLSPFGYVLPIDNFRNIAVIGIDNKRLKKEFNFHLGLKNGSVEFTKIRLSHS